MATVPGIDVSYWNAGIDWPKVRATGQRYVFIKASEGIPIRTPPSTTTGLVQKMPDFCGALIISSAATWMPKKQATSSLIM